MPKRGSSLIETMVAMVLLLIICLSSAYFFAIPPFRKEALRFAALERAAGMLDFVDSAQQPFSLAMGLFFTGFYQVSDGINPKIYWLNSDDSMKNLQFYSSSTNKSGSVFLISFSAINRFYYFFVIISLIFKSVHHFL